MKIALIFHGISSGKNEKGVVTNITEFYFKQLIDKLIGDNEYDIFFHTWDNYNKEELVKFIKPKKYIFEDSALFKTNIQGKVDNLVKNINFQTHDSISNKEYLFSFFSRFKSLYESVKLIENSDIYDLVIISRFDLYIHQKIHIKELEKNYLYINKFQGQELINGNINAMLDGVMKTFDKDVFNYGIQDFFFIGDKNTCLKFSKLYENLISYLSDNKFYKNKWPRILSGHSLCKFHIDQKNIKCKYTTLEEFKHFCLIRGIIENSEENILKKNAKLKGEKKFEEAINLLLDYQKNTPSWNIYNEIAYIYVMKLDQPNRGILFLKKSLEISANKIAYESIIKMYMFYDNKTEAKKYCIECLCEFKSDYVEQIYNQLKCISFIVLGTRQSGSTRVYNLIRFLYKNKRVYTKAIKCLDEFKNIKGEYDIIVHKSHNICIDELDKYNYDFKILPLRNLLDCALSCQKRFLNTKDKRFEVSLKDRCLINISKFNKFNEVSNIIFQYENYSLKYIENFCKKINLDIDYIEIINVMKKLNNIHNSKNLIDNDLSQSVNAMNNKTLDNKYTDCLLTKSHNTSGGKSNNYIYEIETETLNQLLNVKEINIFLKKFNYL